MKRIVVYHTLYGCESGCCGHTVEIEGTSQFEFSHPNGQHPIKFAKDLVRKIFGEDHVKDLDWENCVVIDDCW